MSKTTATTNNKMEGDLVLREVWRAKDALSTARGHSVEKLFADLQEREHPNQRKPIDKFISEGRFTFVE